MAARRLLQELVDPRAYGRIAYLFVAFPLGLTWFVVLVTVLSFGVGTAITLIGIPVLVGAMYAWRWAAQLERATAGALLGVRIAPPYRPAPPGGSLWDSLRARVTDPATWKDLAFLLLQFPLGLASFVIATVVLSAGLGALAAPVYAWALPEGIELGFTTVDNAVEALPLTLAGAVILLLGIPGLSALGRLYGSVASALLGSNEDPELTAEVSSLRDARARIIAAADSERRRLERDLHDGAQQRLVSLALMLRMAEKRAADGDDEALELVRKAGEEAGMALEELRDLARGIHPAILTNRGLAAALADLAARATLPVEVVAAPAERLPEPVEAAAYFAVSECLANVGKHAGAQRATVTAVVEGDTLVVDVRDDGVGGADPAGSGMRGLEDRLGALEGTLRVVSPPGEGTLVRARIPIVGAAVQAAAADPLAVAAMDPAEAAERRRRWLERRLIVYATIAFVPTLVWALADRGTFWPIWYLLWIGAIAGLDALFTIGPRSALVRLGGALAIVNTALIGTWLASGAGYPWPAWPLMASLLVVCVVALWLRPATRRRPQPGR